MLKHRAYDRLLVLSWDDGELIKLFDDPHLDEWNVVPAKSSAAASIVLQSNPCDMLLADQSHFLRENITGISWLAEKERIPIVFMADVDAAVVSAAYEAGISLWIPHRATLKHPILLSSALRQVRSWKEVKRSLSRNQSALNRSQQQVDRLVSLLCRTATLEFDKRWYTQRHMLDRLDEEISRAGRYQTPLSIALGEIDREEPDSPDRDLELKSWLVDEIAAKKRRSDVCGQYGRDGFMLLLSHTPSEGAMSCCRRLQQHLEQAKPEAAGRESVRTYFGLASFGSGAATVHRILRCAEERLEKAKRDEVSRVVGDHALCE